MSKEYSNERILEGIKTGNSEILSYVYKKYWHKIIKDIIKLGASEEEAQDIFQVVLHKLHQNLKHKNLTVKYFASYLKKCCISEYYALRKREKIETISDEDLFLDIVDESFEKPDYSYLVYCFNQLQDDCKEILRLRSDKYDYDEISKIMGFQDGKFARLKKYRCTQYFLKIWRDNNER